VATTGPGADGPVSIEAIIELNAAAGEDTGTGATISVEIITTSEEAGLVETISVETTTAVGLGCATVEYFEGLRENDATGTSVAVTGQTVV